MRNPVMTMAGHLMWSRSGTVWATWRLVGSPYGFAADDAKTEVRRLHQMLLRAHHGEALLLGLRSAVDPASVIERMIDGVNLQACPDWAAECEAALDLLDGVEMSSRTFWLAVPLANDGRTRISEPIRSAFGSLKDALAMPRGGVPADVLTARLAQAQRIEQTLPSAFEPRRATVAEQIWIQLHAQQRGLLDEVAPPERGDDLAEHLLTPRRGAGIPDVITDEGARGDLDKGEHRSVDPRKRCFLKLDSGLPEASYQAMVVLTDVPSEGMAFPGSEFLGRVDEAGPYVDWAVRLNIRSRDEVLARNRKAVRNLNDQYQQREAEASTGANELDIASATLADYQTALASDELEVEVEATVIFAVAAGTADLVEESAASFTQHYAGVGYSVPRPIGHQTALWWAMLPGVPTSRVVKDYSQIATSRGFSASCPLISSDLGDRTGELFGFEISGAAPSPVLLDVKGASTVKNMSGSIAFCGEMGSGKSVGLKVLASSVADRGGQWIAIDRSESREWVTMARALPRYAIVDILQPEYSCDPLRLFGPIAGARVAQSFLIPLCNATPTSTLGLLLSDVLDAEYLQQHQLTTLGALLRHLREDCELPGANDLVRLMNVYARKDLGRVIFDETLPSMPLEAAAIVFATQGLELPEGEQLTQQHLFDQLSLEARFGRAMYAFIAAIGRHVAFADPSRLVMFLVDECHHVTATKEGEKELIPFIREGRKAGAALGLGSQDAGSDFGSATLRGLIPYRVLMRHQDPDLAARGLEWLGLNPEDPTLLHLVTKDTSPVGESGTPVERRGEGLMRDGRGRHGRVKVLMPARAARAAAMNTTPQHAASEAGQ